MTIPDRINSIIHPLMAKRVCSTYRHKMRKVRSWHPELFKPITPDVLAKHKALWGRLDLGVTDYWVTWLSNISGVVDYRYCPEDLFYGRVERVLNDCQRQYHSADDKNAIGLYVDKALQARTILRFIRGAFYDEDGHFVDDGRAKAIVEADHGDMIGKVCVHALGGHSISLFRYENGRNVSTKGTELTLDFIRRSGESYLLQEKIEQHPFSAKFNPDSANSCKIMTLRRPWDGGIDVVAAGMRFGVTSDVFDNLSSGGISVALDPKTGALGKTAHNWYRSDPFPRHPVTGIEFAGNVHPQWQAMRSLAISLADNVPYMNVISWDMIADRDGAVKVIEANAASQSTDWLQFDFGGLFGEYTEQVVDWCVANVRYDRFAHFRTWY